MTGKYDINIQPGHIARHTPRNAGAQGREAAVVDIAQDLLLRHLHDEGLLNGLVIKGGTAIRKLYAGNEGRFSLDLDFAVAEVKQSREDAALSFVASVGELRVGPFLYGVRERRGKWSVTFSSSFVAEPILATKIDFSPAPWLQPVRREWIPMPIHDRYDGSLPQIKTVRLEENISEKIARLNRTTTARDMYDLAWISSQRQLWGKLDKALIRQLVVLKIWTDSNGIHAGNVTWGTTHAKSQFDPKRWLRLRGSEEFDMEDIGALAVPTPKPEKLSECVSTEFAFLAELDAQEEQIARSDPRDRSLAIKLLEELPGGRLSGGILY